MPTVLIKQLIATLPIMKTITKNIFHCSKCCPSCLMKTLTQCTKPFWTRRLSWWMLKKQACGCWLSKLPWIVKICFILASTEESKFHVAKTSRRCTASVGFASRLTHVTLERLRMSKWVKVVNFHFTLSPSNVISDTKTIALTTCLKPTKSGQSASCWTIHHRFTITQRKTFSATTFVPNSSGSKVTQSICW